MRHTLSRVARLFKNAKPPVRTTNRAVRLAVEAMEDRVVPASYNLTAGANTLAISLDMNESVTVDVGATTTTFALSTGTWTQNGDVGGGAVLNVLTIDNADYQASLSIDDSDVAVGPSINNVFFNSGTATSAAIDVSIAVSGDDTILFSGGALSSTGTVNLAVTTGNISTSNGTTDVTASTLSASASTGVALDTSVSTLTASGGTGGVFIVNSGAGALTIDVGGVSATGGSINIANSDSTAGTGSLIVNGAVSNTGGGDIILNATDTVDAVLLDVNAAIAVTNGAGIVQLLSDNSVSIDAAVSTQGGSITINSASDGGVGAFTSGATGTLTTQGGSISIGNGVGNSPVSATIGGAVTVNTGGGSIIIQAAETVLINAALAVTTGGTGVITVSADDDNTATGDITTTAAISTTGGDILIGGGAQLVTIGGAVTVAGSGGSIGIQAEGNALINAALAVTTGGTGVITVSADADNTATGDVVSTAGGTITTAGGAIIIGGGAQLVTIGGTVNGGLVNAVAEGALAVNASVGASAGVNLTGATVTTTAAVSGVINATLIATAGGITTNAAVLASGGAALLQAAGPVTVNANLSGTTGTNIFAIDAASTGQDVVIGAAATVGVGNAPVNVQAGDNLTVAGTITSGSGVITLVGDFVNLDAGVGSIVAVTGTLTSTMPVQIIGGIDADTFNIVPQVGTLNVTGGDPAAPTSPGDVLSIDTTGVAGTDLTFAAGTGSYTFTNRGAIAFTGIETPTALVTITATDATADEAGTDGGQFTVTRVGSTAADLTVSYTITGTATNGADFSTLSGTVVIPAGSATAVINVVVATDALAEGAETVIVTLTAGAGYAVGADAAATVSITDNPPVPAPTTTSAAVSGTDVVVNKSDNTSVTVPVPPLLGVPVFAGVFGDLNGNGSPDVLVLTSTGVIVMIDGTSNSIVALFFFDANGDGIGDAVFQLPSGQFAFYNGATGVTTLI